MNGLGELRTGIVKIRDAVNQIEVKGEHNASRIMFACAICDAITEVLDRAIDQLSTNQNGEETDNEEDVDGEQD